MKLQLITIAMLIAATSWARLGESEAQCDQRYENGTISSQNIKTYQKDDIGIRCEFINKKCAKIIFESKRNLDSSIPDLLAANAGKSKWEELEKGKKWQRADKGAFAAYSKNRLEITDANYEAAKKAKETSASKSAVKGF
ncbi:MAG: hypothetical protein A2X49_02110 [Lentisphaerae bacterium GWF2_52_8]|nr:MAG: hypothetical protein A2X49_02110 [Lentisphaerae bacterium GWF2_52_8]